MRNTKNTKKPTFPTISGFKAGDKVKSIKWGYEYTVDEVTGTGQGYDIVVCYVPIGNTGLIRTSMYASCELELVKAAAVA